MSKISFLIRHLKKAQKEGITEISFGTNSLERRNAIRNGEKTIILKIVNYRRVL